MEKLNSDGRNTCYGNLIRAASEHGYQVVA